MVFIYLNTSLRRTPTVGVALLADTYGFFIFSHGFLLSLNVKFLVVSLTNVYYDENIYYLLLNNYLLIWLIVKMNLLV
jgi:hypothetical protein